MPLSQHGKTQYKCYTLLSLLYLTIMVGATSIAYKPVQIFWFTATASSLLFAFTFAISSVVAEVYGKDRSRLLINQVITCGLIFALIVNVFPHLPSPTNWHHQEDFNYVFGQSMRFAIVGTIGSWISYRINIHLITKWKVLTQGRYFPLRTVGSNTCGEFFLVLIVTFGAFSGVFPMKQVVSMFLFAYISKVIYALILAWPAGILAALIKKREGVDVYDDKGR